MNELALSNDLKVITAEINSYKQIAGQAIFEIGKRLKHVKENDLVHGEFGKWLESIDVSNTQAHRFMKVYEQLPQVEFSDVGKISFNVLYEIATLPDQQREHAFNDDGTAKSVREIQELKKQLKQAQKSEEIALNKLDRTEQDNRKLGQLLTEERNRKPEPIEKEVIKEVIPEHIKQQLQEKDRFLKATKKEYEQLQDELKILKAQQPDGVDDDLSEQKLKRLEREASIETMELAVNIRRFLKETSLTQYQVGALAKASESYKKKALENVEILEQFTKNIKTALNGRIEI